MLTPTQYADRYRNLEVYVDPAPVTVDIHRYHIGAPTSAKDVLWTALREHFRVKLGRDPTYELQLRVNNDSAKFTAHTQMLQNVVRPFWGKGSPEDCQIVLQLAVLLEVTTKPALQAYADANIGLDCNGFVGNYLFRELGPNPWYVDPGERDVGPSSLITQISNLGRPVRSLETMSAGRMYLLAEVDAQGNVMPGGPGRPAGHLAITEPNRFNPQSFVSNSFGGLDLRASRMGAYGNPAYWAVESTGGIGLAESWYAFPPNEFVFHPVRGALCRVFRGSKGSVLRFRVTELN
jgi:hypothetical protein